MATEIFFFIFKPNQFFGIFSISEWFKCGESYKPLTFIDENSALLVSKNSAFKLPTTNSFNYQFKKGK